MLEGWGREVLVGNPRKLRMIYNSNEKNDDRDAEMLTRMARFDPQLLSPIHHRGRRAAIQRRHDEGGLPAQEAKVVALSDFPPPPGAFRWD